MGNFNPCNKKKARMLTEDEIKLLEQYSALRLPMDTISTLLKIDLMALRRLIKKHDNVRAALEEGRAKASTKVRQTLYLLATGLQDKNGHYNRQPEFQALKFWFHTQENVERPIQKIEISGPQGMPIQTKEMTKDELKAWVKKLREVNDLTDEDEDKD